MAPLPDALDRAVRAWEGSGRFAGSAPMKSWAKKDVHNGELKLLAHACVGTVLETPMWERIWGVLTSLEKDFVVVQWKGLVEHYSLYSREAREPHLIIISIVRSMGQCLWDEEEEDEEEDGRGVPFPCAWICTCTEP